LESFHADAGHDSSGRGLALILIVSDEHTDFDPLDVGVEQPSDPLPGRPLSLVVLPPNPVLSTPEHERRTQLS
jgi:hypothetical protein